MPPMSRWEAPTGLPLRLGFLSASNILAAFAFQWYILTRLGSGAETDALFAGMTIPQLLLAVVSDSLMHVLVPLLAGEDRERSRRDAWGFAALVGGLFALLALLFAATAAWWVPLAAPGFTTEGRRLMVELTRVQLAGMVFIAVNGVQWAAYHARGEFLWAEATPLVSNMAALLLLLWALPRHGVVSAAWILTGRSALQTLLLAPGMGRPVRVDLRAPSLLTAWKRLKPLLIGTSYYKTDPLVDRVLLSTTVSGNLSLYHFAQQLYGAAAQVINRAIAAPLVPALSCLHKGGDREGFRRLYRRRVAQVTLLGLGALLVVALPGERLLRLLIGYGSITPANVADLWWMMLWLGGMFLGSILGQISSTSFYASGDTSTPTRLSIWTYTVYLPLKVLAFLRAGIMGLALATSALLIVNFLLQHRILRSRLR
jgi:peptidoglycan biosynthesis protein MviN/MurJ (putative lipid II flippase)